LVGNALPFARFTTQPGPHLLIGSAETDVL